MWRDKNNLINGSNFICDSAQQMGIVLLRLINSLFKPFTMKQYLCSNEQIAITCSVTSHNCSVIPNRRINNGILRE